MRSVHETFIINNYSGVRAYSPIADTADQERQGVAPQAGWYLYDFSELDKSDVLLVLMLDDWQNSIGVSVEIAFAVSKEDTDYYCTLQIRSLATWEYAFSGTEELT